MAVLLQPALSETNASQGSTAVALDLLNLPLIGSALIEASAGTGKTYTIAALYLRAVLGHGGQPALLPPQLLVVTFTEAATGELTERIRQRLTTAARYFRDQNQPADPVLQQLAASYPLQQWPWCAQQLELAAQWMDEAAISTIHGWCNRMLAEHAFDSGSRFEDELSTDQSALMQEVTEDYWRSFVYALDTKALLRWQRSFRHPAQLQADLRGIWREQPQLVTESPAALIADELQQRSTELARLKAPWLQWVAELRPLFEEARQQKRLNGTKLRADYLDKWLTAIAAWASDPLQDSLNIGAGSSRLTPEGIADACKGEPLQHPAFAAMAALNPALAQLPDCTQALRQHALGWCQQRFADSQRQLGCFGFDDMLDRLQQALLSARGASLAARIRQQFPLALIDEFQDTDPVQYGIFRQIYQLAENRSDCGLLLIGDPKQAIYAFRGADIYTYLQAKLATAPRHYSLDTNFRSSQAMVDTVNLLFLQAENRSTGQGAFLFRQQQNLVAFEAVKAKGRPEQLQRAGQAMPALELVLLDESAKPLSKASYFSQMAQHCAGHIALLLQEGAAGTTGFARPDGQFQPLQPQDIAVLVNNQQEAGQIRRALQQVGVRSVYLSDRGSVFETAIAADLLLWLEACADPQHELKVRSALACQSVGWDYLQLARLQQDEWFFEFWLTEFDGFSRLWQQQGVLPLVRQLLLSFGLVQRFASLPDGERQLTDLLHLAELLQQVSRTLEGEQALLRYFKEHLAGAQQLDAEMLKLRLESDEALVRVVTIHKSKGLEYPLVFLPFIAAAKPLDPAVLPYRYHDDAQQLQLCYQQDEQLFAKAETERLGEDLRKLYVALTRSRHYCYLGLAALKDASAISYLLTEQGQLLPGELARQLSPLQHPALQLTTWQATPAGLPLAEQVSQLPPVGDYLRMPKRQRYRWWAASYSALAEGAGQTPQLSAGIGSATLDERSTTLDTDTKDAELYQELQQEQKPQLVLPDTAPQPAQAISQLFLRGATAGTLLHDCLQWTAEQGFAAVLAQPEPLRDYLISQCQQLRWLWPVSTAAGAQWQRRLLQGDAELDQLFASAEVAVEPLWRWLLALLTVRWPAPGTATAVGETVGMTVGKTVGKTLALADLTDYRAELEFWFAAHSVATAELDQLLQQWLWPQHARPALQPRLVHGMLKGFIDLTFAANGQYHVADYKSNYLENAAYTEAELVNIMLAKRYDLQAALYALALHRLLQSRLPGYRPEQHLGQACYWFVRGARPEVATVPTLELQGMLLINIPLPLVLALDAMFRAGSTAPALGGRSMNKVMKGGWSEAGAWLIQAQRWQQLGILRPLDLALVKMLAQQADSEVSSKAGLAPQERQDILLWLALASSQLAQGHLCLDVAQALQQPELMLASSLRFGRPLQELQQFVQSQSLAALQLQLAKASLWVGQPTAVPMPAGNDNHHDTAAQLSPFIWQHNRLYLYRYWQYEQQISQFIRHSSVRTAQQRQQLCARQVRQLLTPLFPTAATVPAATDWQQLACAMAVSSSMAVITGGPGTGKTTTVVKLLLLLQQLALSQGRALTIALAAPTGKAAARLSLAISQALDRLLPGLPDGAALAAQIPAKAQTLHRLLGSGPDQASFRFHADEPLPLDVLVVDEASMVDVALFAAMLAALPASARLILLGDKDQLASVEAGAVMAELCRDAQVGGYSQATAAWLQQLTGQQLAADYCTQTPAILEQQLVMLRTSHRFAADSGIGQLALAVNQGEAQQVLTILQQPPADIRLLTLSPDSAEFAFFLLHGTVTAPLQQGFAAYLQQVQLVPGETASPEQLEQWALLVLQLFSQFQLLCAVRQGKYGVEQLNQRVAAVLARQQLIPRTEGWYPGRPVMVVQNDYGTGLMNGDVGICLPRYERVDGQWQHRLRVVFPAAEAGQPVRWILPSRLPQVETVYAMTVHKSQGSEFQHAVLVLPEQGSALLTRELVYTGITRAARQFSLLCADPLVLSQAVRQKTERSGGLRLQL